MEGLITHIQKCSVHDGPGIRTTVFLKGCNLRCVWCHNPETISFEPEILYYPERCIGCGMCDDGCFAGAKVPCGRGMTAAEVCEEVLQDRAYYGEGGGVTVSGGEPLCRAAFVRELMSLCRQAGIHTAVETNLLAGGEALADVLEYCDLVMADLKLWDEEKHRLYTGAGNSQVLENLRMLSGAGIPCIVRTPVVGGIHTAEEIDEIARFLSGLKGLLYYELLPYHALGLSKGTHWEQERFSAPPKEELAEMVRRAARHCSDVRVAGKKAAF